MWGWLRMTGHCASAHVNVCAAQWSPLQPRDFDRHGCHRDAGAALPLSAFYMKIVLGSAYFS